MLNHIQNLLNMLIIEDSFCLKTPCGISLNYALAMTDVSKVQKPTLIVN